MDGNVTFCIIFMVKNNHYGTSGDIRALGVKDQRVLVSPWKSTYNIIMMVEESAFPFLVAGGGGVAVKAHVQTK